MFAVINISSININVLILESTVPTYATLYVCIYSMVGSYTRYTTLLQLHYTVNSKLQVLVQYHLYLYKHSVKTVKWSVRTLSKVKCILIGMYNKFVQN